MYQKLFDQNRTGQIASAPVQTTGGTVAVRRAKRLLLSLMLCAALPWSLNAQDLNISGTVTGSDGEPVVGASVVVKGSTVGVATGAGGSYSITAPADATLVFSFLGMATREEAVAGRGRIDVTLGGSDQYLDEVVVVGYGVQKKRDLTGAVSSVKMDDAPVGTFSTISHALAGKAAGLQVTQSSAQAGGGAKFRIRGETSPSGGAGNEPLFIIDGFPISPRDNAASGNQYNAGTLDNVLASINPNDIESIEVLKDASATAIYGSRAGHGVIIITTKRGKQGEKVKVSYSGNVSVQQMKTGYEMLSAREFMEQNNKDASEKFLYDNGLDIYAGYRPTTSNVFDGGKYTPEQIASAATTDWLGEIVRTGMQHSHNLSLTGGTESVQYLASVNYFNQEGILKNNNANRFTANANLDNQLSKYFKTGFSLNVSRNQYDNVPLGSSENEASGIIAAALRFSPFTPVRDPETGELSTNPLLANLPNPVGLLDISDKTTKDRLLGSAYLQANPIKDLTLKLNVGVDRGFQKRQQYVPTTVPYGKNRGGRADVNENSYVDYLANFTAQYVKTFGEHNVTALAGYEYQQFNSESLYAGNQEFPIDGYIYNNLNVGAYAKPSVGSGASSSSLGSYFGRINYSFMGRYLLTATIRADGDSDFNPDYRWGYFPSISLGWRFSDESFMAPVSNILSNGKLRGSYGETGNSNVGNRISDAYGSSGSFIFGGNYAKGVGVSRVGNPKLTWETTTEYNIGLDLGFLKNRINLSAEYYHRVISDLLVTNKALMSYSEPTSITDRPSTAANIGKTQGTGVELTLNTVNIKSSDWTWTTDISLTSYEDRWLERDPDWKPNVYQSENDYVRSIYKYRSDGLLQAGEAAPAWQAALAPGQIKLINRQDEEGLENRITAALDQELIGSEDPAMIFGVNNTVRWKNLDFNIYFYGEVGRLRGMSYYEAWATGFNGDVNNMSKGTLDVWQHDNQGSTRPSAIPNQTFSGGVSATDYYYKKISYIRCRNITLGYTVPVPKTLISTLRVYADVNNPFVISNWTGIDPETDGHNYAYPSVRSFSLGVEISF
ncbi:MAG: TonB-dependent receptor [Prevotellaceae bacterium]|nr:TonB-dependent receptor [Prevotellaceae bacterium]